MRFHKLLCLRGNPTHCNRGGEKRGSESFQQLSACLQGPPRSSVLLQAKRNVGTLASPWQHDASPWGQVLWARRACTAAEASVELGAPWQRVGMPLKVVVELQIHAVSCPGVYLPERNDVYLHVSILGQCKETDSLPPIFPLFFHEKMWFEKVFEKATDPAAVVELLERNVTRFRLSEMLPSEEDEEDLAFYEENTRDFLFPEPKLTPTYPGVDRELLMKKYPSFPGIAPKLEFATRTTITQLPLQSRKWYRDRNKIRLRRASSASPRRRSVSPTRCRATMKNRSTRRFPGSMRSCSPSPTRAKCLHESYRENQQQQQQQQLSPVSMRTAKFKGAQETEPRPPFVVRHVDASKKFTEQTPLEETYQNARQNVSPSRNSHKCQLKRALSFDSWKTSCPAPKVIREPDEPCSSDNDSSSLEREPVNYKCDSPTCCRKTAFASPQRYRSPSPSGRWASPQHRIYSSPSSSWDEINERVRNLLSSDEARQRLSTGATDSEIDDVLERRSISLRSSPLCGSLEQRYCI
ncbi:spermatogenesis associated 6-like protein isoform X2 [Hemicordylus capensis]|uniref:spermatogenesis associated 6-like protein isoform X2 n=1 Tax=Hemicordylus capensis TaxID=884348 RepID=UPI0023036038|nr:spermatogenesis associated 6-like protein isoform X2 [Hemicordylus capensis]